MNKLAIIIGLFVLTISLLGKTNDNLAIKKQLGITVSNYSNEITYPISTKNTNIKLKKTYFSPTLMLLNA